MRRLKYPTVRRGDYLDLSDLGHELWMRDNNPDNWDTATWRAFSERCARDAGFLERCKWAKANGESRPHPTADGWLPSKEFDPIAGLGKRMRA